MCKIAAFGKVARWTLTVGYLLSCLCRETLASQNEYCYEIRWQLSMPEPKRQLMRPATRFPSSHSLVQNPVCSQRNAGDLIPAAGQHSETGNQADCKSVNAAALFYAYDYPNGASSNTGYERAETDIMYFVMDDNENAYFGKLSR